MPSSEPTFFTNMKRHVTPERPTGRMPSLAARGWLTGLLMLGWQAVALALPQQARVPGGIALLELPDYTAGTQVRFDGKRVAVFSHRKRWYALAGIALDTRPGDYTFEIRGPDGRTVKKTVHITDKQYEEQHLTIKNKRKVNPEKRDIERIRSESRRKRRAKRHYSETEARVDFIWPVSGRISSIFGLRRFFNGQERRPHNGLDIAAGEGTPIRAAASGRVIESGDFFFSGNMVFLDHGQGIISLYAHMRKINVKPGDRVEQGDIIGEVGHTGRATGPHLHFAVIANQTLVDPVFMLPPQPPDTTGD